ncbi:MAG: hypothetical protein ABI969_20495 [bacterium]
MESFAEFAPPHSTPPLAPKQTHGLRARVVSLDAITQKTMAAFTGQTAQFAGTARLLLAL